MYNLCEREKTLLFYCISNILETIIGVRPLELVILEDDIGAYSEFGNITMFNRPNIL